jgi:hypothetical protein
VQQLIGPPLAGIAEQRLKNTAGPRIGSAFLKRTLALLHITHHPRTEIRRRPAGSWQAIVQGKHAGTFATALEAAAAIEAAEAQAPLQQRGRGI